MFPHGAVFACNSDKFMRHWSQHCLMGRACCGIVGMASISRPMSVVTPVSPNLLHRRPMHYALIAITSC
eukprot:scaffold41578_cov18-Prasinocladus_malaysianus.AAC.2